VDINHFIIQLMHTT